MNPINPIFTPFPKIARLNREVVVTEKIDGTNAQVYIDDYGVVIQAGSRNQFIGVDGDNFGFAKWVEANKTELLKLGPGCHYGEWWGSGIQRGYGLKNGEKRFSLFNVGRWGLGGKETPPNCCCVVPVLWRGNFEDMKTFDILEALEFQGSNASPGFMNPEGIIIYHTASKQLFKKTLKNDEKPKGSQE